MKQVIRAPFIAWSGFVVLLAFRFWLSAALPMTGDEGYFVFWGHHPAGGYYDHPPMVGWWLSGLLAVSRAEWFLRLPATLLPLVLAGCGWWLVKPRGHERARLAAILILLQPVNVWNVLITTDTPVILFSMLSIVAYVAALRCDQRVAQRNLWYVIAGLLLGMAFLGKYFAALLGVAYLVHLLFVRRAERRWGGFLLLLLAALPAPLYNLWWNSQHCWVNILFNFLNRNTETGLTWRNPAFFVLSLAYLATPWLVLALWRERLSIRLALSTRPGHSASAAGDPSLNAAFWLMTVPLFLFALMSLWRSVGLHWLVSFIPLAAVLAAIVLPLAELARLAKWSALFAVAHCLCFALIALLPAGAWQGTRLGEGVAMRYEVDGVLARLDEYGDDRLLAMESFSAAAFMAYKSGQPVAVFGSGSFYARQDDFETDWRQQNRRKMLILRTSAPDPNDYRPYFEQVTFRDFTVNGFRFHLILGDGFNYPVYHERVLRRIRDRFYRIPSWLPQRGCEFCERYFPDK